MLALWLRGDAFTAEEKRRAFDYYEAITVRDSSLSASAQAVVAAEVGHLDLAWEYLREAALTDLDDLHHNAGAGCTWRRWPARCSPRSPASAGSATTAGQLVPPAPARGGPAPVLPADDPRAPGCGSRSSRARRATS